MRGDEARQVYSSAELSVGDEIEAWHNGKLFHRGQVAKTVASMDLFWLVDARTGTRRLIDVEALVILRAAPAETSPRGTGTADRAAGSPTAGPGTTRNPAAEPGARAAAAGRTTSHLPLFQAPSLAV